MLTPPTLWPAVDSSPGEAAAIKELSANLWGVAYNVEGWHAALKLYEYTNQAPSTVSRGLVRQWRFIASQECVMQLHHLKDRMQKIKGLKLRGCKSISESIDGDKLRKAARLFDEYFPHIDHLRHAVAHAGANDVNASNHAPNGGLGLVGFPEPDRFSAPYLGVIRHLDITIETWDRINEIATEFLCAFETAAELLERRGHAE